MEYSKTSLEEPMEETPKTEPQNKKIINGEVITKNKKASVFQTSDAKEVGKYLLSDVIIPAIKEFAYNIITKGSKEWLYPGSKNHKTTDLPGQRVSYKKYYDDRSPASTMQQVIKTESYNYSDIIFKDRQDAIDIYNTIDATIKKFGVCKVADLYEFVGRPTSSTDFNYGWSSIKAFAIVPTEDGYWLKAPKAYNIDY